MLMIMLSKSPAGLLPLCMYIYSSDHIYSFVIFYYYILKEMPYFVLMVTFLREGFILNYFWIFNNTKHPLRNCLIGWYS